MRLFGKVNNQIDRFDRAQYLTPPFDAPFADWMYYLGSQPYDGGRVERYSMRATDSVLQLYISGELYGWSAPDQGIVEFHIPDSNTSDVIFPLAVDREDATTDFWATAFPELAAQGNKIKLQTPQLMTNAPSDVWRVYRGDAGDGSATILMREQEFYPGGRRASGYGLGAYGSGGYGWDGTNSIGYGYNYGIGEYGFDADMLEHVSGALPPGAYPVKGTITDAAGNVSSETTDTVTLDTYARPASDLTVESYTQATDALALSWTESPDIT